VVINITTGGAATMTIEERLQPALQHAPEVASLNMGSMNFGLYPMLDRYKDLKPRLGAPYLEGSDDRVFKNTFKDIAYILTSCARNGTRFEIECYDIGHLYTAAHFLDRKLIKGPLFIQSVFGIRGGIGAHPEDVAHMKRTPTACSATTTCSRCWARAATRCRWPTSRMSWAATCASAWRTTSGTAPASSPRATRSRCRRSAGLQDPGLRGARVLRPGLRLHGGGPGARIRPAAQGRLRSARRPRRRNAGRRGRSTGSSRSRTRWTRFT
jgi:hypothetical protein